MKIKLASLFVLSFLLFSGCARHVMAPDKFSVKDNLPRAYSGTFEWHGGKSVKEISIVIGKVYFDSESNVIAEGTGKYITKMGNINIDIKIKISPETLRFEMWEMNPEGNISFVTDGSHVGNISNDLKTIKAVWTTKSSGKQGDLKLKAD
jgi:hypothetical protein